LQSPGWGRLPSPLEIVNSRLASEEAAVTEPIAHVLRTYLVETYLPHTGSATLRDDEDLFDTGILDSASALALLFFVEERFGISVPDDDFLPENFASIAAATTYIGNRQVFEAQLDKVSEGGA
jgi:acyl carrier protein